ncbi:hypothetical protein CEXT_261701 [Caerostris extrusa]|uniref:Uncharacterized protein n=1 Tax=Caerostris extrusa TaxID=172846 RepID=A0AAV4PKJ9_CAEEX|nr:hypothetical protein CEXT_261701 [Caerostris extrusa]
MCFGNSTSVNYYARSEITTTYNDSESQTEENGDSRVFMHKWKKRRSSSTSSEYDLRKMTTSQKGHLCGPRPLVTETYKTDVMFQ